MKETEFIEKIVKTPTPENRFSRSKDLGTRRRCVVEGKLGNEGEGEISAK